MNEEYTDELCQAELKGHQTKGTKAWQSYTEYGCGVSNYMKIGQVCVVVFFSWGKPQRELDTWTTRAVNDFRSVLESLGVT